MRPQLVARIPSLSDPTQLHDVVLRNGTLVCDCQAFYSWRKRGLKCWHLRVYEASEKALDRCWTNHNTADGFVCRSCLYALVAAMTGRVKEHYVDKLEAKEKIKRARASKKKSKATSRGRRARAVDKTDASGV